MAYNIGTLSVRKGEVIKYDKIQFIIDYIRSLKSEVDSIKSSYMKIPSSSDIILISTTSSFKLPNYGKWFVDVHFICSEFSDMSENSIADYYAGIKNGGSTIRIPSTDSNYIIAQGFACRVV